MLAVNICVLFPVSWRGVGGGIRISVGCIAVIKCACAQLQRGLPECLYERILLPAAVYARSGCSSSSHL